MRSHALPCVADHTMDIVGTGGDGIDTFNVSTAASLVVAGAGVRIMKHGNRSNSSKCGSADLLEALGARLDVDGAQAVEVLNRAKFCFLFAQKFHPSMRHVGPARRQMKIRTIFNILG
jgi:anthranilate phosphoribosyltransferase